MIKKGSQPAQPTFSYQPGSRTQGPAANSDTEHSTQQRYAPTGTQGKSEFLTYLQKTTAAFLSMHRVLSNTGGVLALPCYLICHIDYNN